MTDARISVALGCGALLAFHSFSLAAEPAPRVNVRDLDLNSNTGVEIALERVKSAAIRVCQSPQVNAADLGRTRATERCVKATMDQTVRQLRSPLVSRMYANSSGTAVEKVSADLSIRE